jgi:hypothetical protein
LTLLVQYSLTHFLFISLPTPRCFLTPRYFLTERCFLTAGCFLLAAGFLNDCNSSVII